MNEKEGTSSKKDTNKGEKNSSSDKKKYSTSFIGVAEASKICGMHPHTLRKYSNEGKIKSYKTPSGQTKFDKQYLEEMCNVASITEKIPKIDRVNYIYTRVSTKKQKDDLQRQIDFIRKRRPEYDTYTTLSDIASGINFKRKGLETILDSCLQGSIGELVIAHRDRLSRFGFELIKLFVEKSGGKLTVLDDERNKSSEQELSEDLLSIIHIYSCRQMGKRSYQVKNIDEITKDKTETDDITEEGF